ncbi:MAG: hypothetical protein RR141_01550 [Rikenellaceae bacterium]
MNKYIDISLLVLMLGAFIFTFLIMKDEEKRMNISKLEINIKDGDSIRFVTVDSITSILKSDSVRNWCTNFSTCDTHQIERILLKLRYVDSVESYKIACGTLNVDIVQKNICFRIMSDKGKDLYVDDHLRFIPTANYFAGDVPIVTCDDEFLTILQESEKKDKKVDKNYYILHNLLNFVRLVESDPFWKSMIVQINISKSRELQLVMRVGTHTAILCDCSDIENFSTYLNKLGGFYTKIVATGGWGKYKTINAKYNNIIVATK